MTTTTSRQREQWVEARENIDAVLIPLGTPVVIPKGTRMRITQRMGGTCTVEVNGNLARVAGKAVAALGLEEAEEQREEATENQSCVVNEALVRETLKGCYDPEIPVNIVDLGLVYDILVVEDDEGRTEVEVTMTLTAPGCGMGPFIVEDVRSRILALPGVHDARVELVFDPPWDRSMMSDAARLQLGMF
ncbi:MAG: putative Fe-S cluster assembly protein SufT [Zetaproteobacteria bacterium]|nr:MAG: putative Fe-S cluster assembly protein SufT [Zetaproteobacteria bacterium]